MDNIFSRIGGLSLPVWDNPTIQSSGELVFYDKKEGQFATHFGLPDGVQSLAKIYGPEFFATNLLAYKNVVVVPPDKFVNPGYEGGHVVLDPYSVLYWLPDDTSGNFYAEIAPVARFVSLNIYERLVNQGVEPDGRTIASAEIVFAGMHGGLRPGQPVNIHMVIDSKRYPLSFSSSRPRTEEVLRIAIDPNDIPIRRDHVMSFAFIVLPFQERFPSPPPSFQGNRRGPAHFRDIIVGKTELLIKFR